MRRLTLLVLVAAGAACDRIDLEKTPRAYACDHLGGDGGRQCTDDWRCAYADKCFHRDAGAEVAALDWQCTEDVQCPDGWQCGLEVEGRRRCQQLGVGAPSPCRLDAGDCQGGWRCALDERCFDPSTRGAGAQTECVSDATCPDGFRCGETVDRVRRCVELGVPVENAPCATDLSCEGGLRCDTFAQACVRVTDVLDSGHLDALGAALVNRTEARPAPLLVSVTRRGLTPRPGGGLGDAVVTGALYDGGVLHSMQFASDTADPDVLDTWLPLPGARTSADVKDLVATSEGAAVHYVDRSIDLLLRSGGVRRVTNAAALLRPYTAREGSEPSDFLWTEGDRVWLPHDAGLVVPPNPDGGSSDVVELVNDQSSTWLFTRAGVFRHHPGSATPTFVPGSPVRFDRTLALAAGRVPLANPADEYKLSFVFLVPMDGGVEVQPWLWLPGDRLATTREPVDACPLDTPHSTAAAVTFASEPNSAGAIPSALVRCVRPDGGGSYTVKLRFRDQQDDVLVRLGPYAEDPVPFAGPWVAMRHSPFARAIAGPERQLWHTTDVNQGTLQDGYALLGDLPLRSVLLDRAPDAILDYQFLGQRRLVAVSNGDLFTRAGIGFLSQTGVPGELLLLAGTNSRNLIVTSLGVLDLSATELAQSPTMRAAPAGVARLHAPASGVAAKLLIAGAPRDVVLVASGDTVWAADITDSRPFAPPSTLTPVMVPTPGISLSSLVVEGDLDRAAPVLTGYLTTASTTLQFKTSDLVHWAITTIAKPATADYPIEAWVEGQAGRVGAADGKVWALPLMVELSRGVPDAGTALDYAALCGDLFVTTSRGGLLRARPSPGALPGWEPVDAVNTAFSDATELQLHPTNERLLVSDPTGRVVEVTRAQGADGGCP